MALVKSKMLPQRPPGALFKERFVGIVADLAKTFMTENWKVDYSSKTPDEWYDEIRPRTAPELVTLLDNEQPPTLQDLKALPYTPTECVGVYGRAMWPEPVDSEVYERDVNEIVYQNEKKGIAIKLEDVLYNKHLYIGSGTGFADSGVRERVRQRSNPNIHNSEPGYHHGLMGQQVVKRGSWFFNVLTMEPLQGTESLEMLYQMRATCMLAEAIFSCWFKAYNGRAERKLSAASPFSAVEWHGACSHSALLESIRSPITSERKKQREREYHKEYYSEMVAKFTPEQRLEYNKKRAEASARYRDKIDAAGVTEEVKEQKLADKRTSYHKRRAEISQEETDRRLDRRRENAASRLAKLTEEENAQRKERNRLDTAARRLKKKQGDLQKAAGSTKAMSSFFAPIAKPQVPDSKRKALDEVSGNVMKRSRES